MDHETESRSAPGTGRRVLGCRSPLQDCYSAGETVEEALSNAREAAEGMLAVLNDRQPFEPEDRSIDDLVKEIEL